MASYTREQFIAEYEKQMEKRGLEVPAEKTARQQFIEEYTELYNQRKKQQGQVYTAPVSVEQTVNVPQEVPQSNVTSGGNRYTDNDLKILNSQISAFNDIKGKNTEEREQLNKLLIKKDEAEKYLKKGLYDENLSLTDRLTLTGQSIAEGYNAAPDVLADTAAQAFKDWNKNRKVEEYNQTKSDLANINRQINTLQYKIKNGFSNQVDTSQLENLLNEQARLQGIIDDKYTTPMDINGASMKKMQTAMQKQQKATEGMSDTAAFYWNVGTSIVDNASLMPLAVLPGGQAAITALMGVKAAAQKAVEVGESGRSAGEALFRGAASGLIESATEKVPLEELVKMAKGPVGKSLIKNMLKQAGTEGTEEVISYIANNIVDIAAKDPNAQWSFTDALMSFLGGAISGGIMGGGASLLGRNNAGAQTQQNAAQMQQEQQNVTQSPQNVTEMQQNATEMQQNAAQMQQGVIPPVENNNSILQSTAKTDERAELEKAVKQAAGIDTRTEVEKTVQEQQERVETVAQMVKDKIAPAEELDKALNSANEKIAEAENRQANLDYQKLDEESGAVRTEAINSGKGKTVEDIERFAAKRGFKVKYYSADADSVGNGFINGDTIYINVQDSNVMYKTAIHETIHGLRSGNSAEYAKLYNEIMGYGEQYKYLNDIADSVMNAYTDPDSIAYQSILTDGEIDADKLGEEVLCKLCEEVIKDPEGFIRNVDGNRGLLGSIADVLRKIKNSLAITLTNSEKAKLDNAVMAIERYVRGEGGTVIDKKFHISINASNEIDNALNDKNYRQEIKLRDYTPAALVEHGVKDLPMLMKASHLRENIFTVQEAAANGLQVNKGINYHGLGKALFMQVIDSLDNPQRVYRGTKNADNSSRGENYFLIISTIKDKDGNSINIPVFVEQKGRYNNVVLDTNKIATVFGRTNINDYINREVKKGNLVKINRSSNKSNGPSPIDGVKDNTASVNNIPQSTQNSNGNNLSENSGVQNSLSISADSGNVDISDDLKGLTIRERIDARANSGVTAKSRNVQTKAENTLIKTISNAFGVKYADKQGVIKEMVKDITAQVKATGTVNAADIDKLVDTAFEKGVISENELAKQYPNLKKELRESRFKYQPGEVFQNVRNNYFGKLLFAKDGTDVDILYKEYSDKYPEIFPKDIINPEDQIVRFADVYDSLAENEQSLASYYGEQSENMKSLIKEDLQYAVDRYIAEINDVSAYETSKRISEGERQIRRDNKTPLTKEEYKAAQDKAYQAQKTVDKLTKDILLTDEENKLVDTLLAGGAPELVSGKNRDKILAVYAAKKAVQDAQAPIKQYKADIRSKRQEIADSVLTTFRSWTDKKIGLGYSTETMERNIRDIVPDSDEAFRFIDTYITPVHQAEADAVRLKNRMRDRVRALNIDTSTKKEHLYKVSLFGESGTVNLSVNESGLVQLFGEKKITEQQLKDCGADVVKIKNAVSEFRKIYNELYDMADYALVRNGYAPLGKIEDYFPHFLEESDTVLSKLAKRAGFEVQTNKLPTSIAGITETFKPGKKWFANALTRTGDTTVFDAVNGFDQYIEGVSGIIYQTDNIQNLRELENRMRYLAGDKGLREQLDAIDANDSLTVEDKQDKKDRLYKEQKNFNLSNFVTYLRDYTNTIAGKKQIQDRGIEHDLGRGIYTMSKALEGRIASNMIGANIGSALTNFIPIAQAYGEIKTKHMLQAMNDTMHAMYGKDNSFEYESDFLTNRFGSDKLVYTWAQNISNKTGVLMTAIDRFTSNVITRARYYQNLENGMERTLAIMDADSFAANVLADRSKGAQPLVFERRNPLVKAVTMFQVEQNNQFRYLLKDLPRGLRDKGKGAIFAALLKYAVASFLYNQLYKKLIGRRPAFDPIDICLGIYKDTSDAVKGNIQTSEAMKNISSDMLEEVPFVSGLAGGGRIPISSAMPDIAQLLKLADGNVSGDKKKQIAWNELKKPLFYIVPPAAGGQLKKGAETYELFAKNKGVEYSVDSDGNKNVKFAAQPTVGNVVRSAAFGKWSLPEAREYIDAGNKGLTKNETTAFNALVDSGMGYLDVKKMLEDRKSADTDGNGKYTKEEAKAYLDKTGYTREQKAILFACMCPSVKNNPYR